MRCASVRKKGSDLQCPAKPLFGHTLCGRHAKCKTPVLWSSTQQDKIIQTIKIQSCVRGWLLRKRLLLAGPGVLNRKQVCNNEDFNTMNEKEKVHPLNYFGFEEHGKIWWFEIDSIHQWMMMSMTPLNPYTKTPLNTQTRKRLRELMSYHQRRKIMNPVSFNQKSVAEVLIQHWNLICQCFQDYGFGEIQPRLFLRLNKHDYYAIFRMIHDDIRIVMKDSEELSKICDICSAKIHTSSSVQYTISSAGMLLYMIHVPRDPYILLFTMLSALYRV